MSKILLKIDREHEARCIQAIRLRKRNEAAQQEAVIFFNKERERA